MVYQFRLVLVGVLVLLGVTVSGFGARPLSWRHTFESFYGSLLLTPSGVPMKTAHFS